LSARIAAALVLLTVAAAGCSAPRVRPVARGGRLDVKGSVAISSNEDAFLSGGLASSADALGLGEQVFFQPRIDVDWPGVHLVFDGQLLRYGGEGVAQGTLSLGPIVIEGDTEVRTDLGADLIKGTILFDVYSNDWLELGIGAGGGYVGYDVSIRSLEAEDLAIGVSDDLPLGYLSFRGAVFKDRWGLILLANGMKIDFEGNDIAFAEIDVTGSFRLLGEEDGVSTRLLLGWRYLFLDYVWEPSGGTLDLHVELTGPYLGLDIRF
jgi:hypothetical protein